MKKPPGEGERKEVAAVKVILEGDPKEIAALVLAVQERQSKDAHSITEKELTNELSKVFWATFAPSTSYGKGEEAP